MINIDETIKERFWAKVDIHSQDECWEWKAFINAGGYGRFRLLNHKEQAHRVAWTLINGYIPSGMLVCHKCDNRKCVNPNHLFLGTQKDNMHDCVSKGRLANGTQSHCINGHEFTSENTYIYVRNGNKWRICRKCHAMREKKYAGIV